MCISNDGENEPIFFQKKKWYLAYYYVPCIVDMPTEQTLQNTGSKLANNTGDLWTRFYVVTSNPIIV